MCHFCSPASDMEHGHVISLCSPAERNGQVDLCAHVTGAQFV
jgi:hypothetical protein